MKVETLSGELYSLPAQKGGENMNGKDSMVAALLTMAVVSKMEPIPAIGEEPKLAVESVIRIYEEICTRLETGA